MTIINGFLKMYLISNCITLKVNIKIHKILEIKVY